MSSDRIAVNGNLASRTRLPGKPKPAQDVLNEWEQEQQRCISAVAAKGDGNRGGAELIVRMMRGDAAEKHRWRIQLDCGHIREVLTSGEDRLPLGPWHDKAYIGVPGRYVYVRVPEGHAPCWEFDCWYKNQPYRDVAEWKTREVHDHPADPEEPDEFVVRLYEEMGCIHGCVDAMEHWATRRHAEPWQDVAWEVVLSCGHTAVSSSADLDWRPEDGIRYGVDSENADQMRNRQEMLDVPGYDDSELKRRYEQMLPHPHPDEQCGFCAGDRMITAYEYAGPLVPPLPKPRKPADPRAALKRRIRAAEDETKRLKAQLAELRET